VADLIVTASADGEAQPIDGRAGGRRRTRPARVAALAAETEAVEVVARRLEAIDLDVHAVSQLGPRNRRASLDDIRKGALARDLPADLAVGHRHGAPARRL